MGTNAIILLLVGILVVVLGFTGILNKSRRGQRMIQLMGETGYKLFTTIIGLILIIVSIFFM